MWTLTSLSNAFDQPLMLCTPVIAGGNAPVTNPYAQLGNLMIMIPYIGDLMLTDIGTAQLGPGTQDWGVRIDLGCAAWAFRYNNNGTLGIAINSEGWPTFSAPPTSIFPISLAAWSGSYKMQSRTGGDGNYWLPNGVLTIEIDGSVMWGEEHLLDVVFDPNTNLLSWQGGGGTANGVVTLATPDTSSNWPPPTRTCSFSGYFQLPGSGQIDLKGVLS
jgi:OAA-family lectin sugar binding domain